MLRKICSFVTALSLAFGGTALPAVADTVFSVDTDVSADTALANSKSVTDYTYKITPILEPFNEYFFVQTDNPDPTSFRFADKSSIYSDDSSIVFDWDDWDEEISLYEDIKYENRETGRVNGGYIFKSYDTDGGEIVLQSKNDAYYSWDVTWSDTNVKLKLPILKDDVDYLIDTYANQSNFFDNMDAVQDGFSSICLYSGSYIRGELHKGGLFWSLSTSPHKDQTFYIQSPYYRDDNKSLFSSAIYPYRYDSLGFPSVMAAISKRLDSSSSYEWDSNYHYLINVTYGGETRSYGGSGNGEGQGISEDKIKQYFTFGTNGTKVTLESARQLLNDYAAIEMEDDVPCENALTWESVCDRIGNGAWVRLYGFGRSGYSYLYNEGDGKSHWADPAGNNGAEIYWGGDLGHASDTWVDGRYVDLWESFVPGEKFEDHPTSDIILKNVTVPQITYDLEYKYNYSTGSYDYKYTNFQITEKEKTVLFCYSESDNIWKASYEAFDDDCADYWRIADFVEKGLIDKKYLDMVTITLDEVKTLEVDKNTDTVPDDYFIYDGNVEPGTSIKDNTFKGWKKIDGKWYYYDSFCTMQTGWIKYGGKWYYLNSSGVMQTGWLLYKDEWYYLSGSGAMQTGWVKVGTKWYYMNGSGAMQTGWVKVGAKWYYMNGSGAMQTGWVKVGTKWYYMNSSGAMQTGWVKVGTKWYYMNSSGAMQTGWLKLSNKWYYLSSSGAMVTGTQRIGGKVYRFSSSGQLL